MNCIGTAIGEIGFGEADPQPVVAVVGHGHVAMQFVPAETARRGGVCLKANLLLDHQQLVRPKSGSRFARMFGRHVIRERARRALRSELQHQGAERGDHERPIGGVRGILIEPSR